MADNYGVSALKINILHKRQRKRYFAQKDTSAPATPVCSAAPMVVGNAKGHGLKHSGNTGDDKSH